MFTSTSKRTGSDDNHAIDRDGSAGDEGDKILTAGPSAWESTSTNLVDELRILVRARDMALAEQRARHVKESVVIREQRHALETTGPASSRTISKLFGWENSAGGQRKSLPDSISPVSVSPIFSRSGSPINSPTGGHRQRGGDWLDDTASRAQFGTETTRTQHAAGALAAGTRDPKSERQTPSERLAVVDVLDVRILEDESGNVCNGEAREQSSPSGTVGPGAPSAPAGVDKGRALDICSRCMRLRHERDMAITERSLAEAELVSLRKKASQMDTSRQCKAEFKGRHSMGPGVAMSGADSADKIAPMSPYGEADSSNHDRGLREELNRLEKGASLADDGLPPSDLELNSSNTAGLPAIQEHALVSKPDEGRTSSRMPDLAASLSAAVTSRARHFEELSRRRLLRMGVETDLRAARAKLDSLFGSAITASPSPDLPRGNGPGEMRGENVEPCGGEGAPSPPEGGAVGHTAGAKERGNGKSNSTDKDGSGSSPPFVSSTRGKGSRAMAGARPGRGRNVGPQTPGRGTSNNRGSVSVPIDAATPFDAGSTPSEESRGSRAKRTTATPKHSKVSAELSPRCPRGDADVATGTIGAHNRKRKGVRDPPKAIGNPDGGSLKKQENVRAQGTASGGAVEGDDAGIVAADHIAEGAAGAKKRRSSCVEQAAHENEGERGQLARSDVIKAPGEKGKGTRNEEYPNGDVCATVSSTSEEANAAAGAEHHLQGRGNPSANEETIKTSTVTKNGALTGLVTQARTPRTSPRRPKGAPQAAAQLRRAPGSPRGLISSGKGAIVHSAAGREARPEEGNQETPAGGSDGSMPASASCLISDHDPGGTSAAKHESFETTGTVLACEVLLDGNGETVADEMEDGRQSGVPEAVEHAVSTETMIPKRDILPKGPTKQNRARIAQRSLHGKAGRGNLPNTRPRGKTAKIKAVPRAAGATPTRLGTTMKARRLTQDGEVRALATGSPPLDMNVAAKESEEVQETKAAEEDGVLIFEDGEESPSPEEEARKEAKVDESSGKDERASTADEGGEKLTATAGPIQPKCPLEAHHVLTAASGGEPVVVDGDKGLGEDGQETGDLRGGLTAVPEQPAPGGTDGYGGLPLPLGLADLAEALRIEVDMLRLEKGELEDTVAQLNVAAVQLYIVEYQQMKAKCRQLKRVVLGPASRPTEVESAYGHSCQEIMHRLKTIGVNFFRRRIGGAMGDRFFPDGLSRVLTLLGRERVAQGCQTAPLERLGSIGKDGALAALPGSRDVHVQVTGGIDAEDEPLMEQQVYALLGRLDILLKRREDVLTTYHREAAEGAREARALLALAAAQHHPGQAWGVSRPPNFRPLIGGRKGPAGAPRPAINPTNLLFSAAAVLDSVAAANAANVVPDIVSTSKPSLAEEGPAESKVESRRQRFSAAEKALLELSDEVVAALEAEQRRSDASAERRRFVADRHNISVGCDTQALGRPPIGVPPLIWAMEIHLVGKLARAFRTAVEARGFEREVEDANLVAAVTLGRSSSPSAKGNGKSDGSSPWHLGHRMLSHIRGDDGEWGGIEEGARRQMPQRGVDNGFKEETTNGGRRENPQFGWGSDTYSPRKTQHRPVSCNGGTDGRQTYRSSPTNSPRKAEGLARGEQSRRQAIKGRAGIRDGHRGPAPNRSGSPPSGNPSESRPVRRNNGSRTTVEGALQDQQRREHQRRDSAAIARVEAAVFDTVRPSRLHPRPGSATVGGRSDRASYGTTAAAERLRPQSARLAEPRNAFPAGGSAATEEQKTAYPSSPPDVERDGRRAYEGDWTLESCMVTAARRRQQQPLRPTPNAAAGRRPASAGGRVVDTRIWSSNKKVVDDRTGVFRCRPNKAVGGASVQFEGAAAGGGVSGLSSSSPRVPTHSGEVPEFLRRKELELIRANHEKTAAANGRFAIVPDDDDQLDRGGGGGSVDAARIDHRRDEVWGHRSNGQRRSRRGSESRVGREGGISIGATCVEKSDVGSRSDDGYGDRPLSSLRIEDSLDGEGLLPDAGEQAFFDAWKPTGYGIDLSRYD